MKLLQILDEILRVVTRKPKVKPKKPYAGATCEKCGQHISYAGGMNKESHFRVHHPEFKFKTEKPYAFGEIRSSDKRRTCLVCGKVIPNFKAMVLDHDHKEAPMIK